MPDLTPPPTSRAAMSKPAALRFLVRAESDAGLRARLEAIEARTPQEALARLAALAREHGHPVDSAGLEEAIREFLSGRPLTEDELERVAGRATSGFAGLAAFLSGCLQTRRE
jgi:hypothetical protein